MSSNMTAAFMALREACSSSLEGWTAGWPSPRPTGFGQCLYIAASFREAIATDYLVNVFAFCYIGAAIAKERQQQLYTRALRRAWYPRVHLSGHAAALYVMEAILSWMMLSWVPMAMLSLVLGSPDGFSAQNMVLNGLSVSFILVLDDELPEFLLSADEIEEIQQDLTESSKGLVHFRVNKMKGFVRSFISIVALSLGVLLAGQFTCLAGGKILIWACAIGLAAFGAGLGEAAVDVIYFGLSRHLLVGYAGEAVAIMLCNAVGYGLWQIWTSLSGFAD
jgi:hypothetical protein